MKTISKVYTGPDASASLVAHIVRSGQWVESTPLPAGFFKVTVAERYAAVLPIAGEAIPGERKDLPDGLHIYGKPSATIDYPQCVAPEKFYLAAPVISANHIMESDALLLETCEHCFPLSSDCGFLIYWSVGADDDELNEDFPATREFITGQFEDRFSEPFRHVIRSFRDLGYNYLRFDSDGDTVTGLPVFEW